MSEEKRKLQEKELESVKGASCGRSLDTEITCKCGNKYTIKECTAVRKEGAGANTYKSYQCPKCKRFNSL